MRPIGLAAILVLASAASALAQAQNPLDLVAKVTAGLSDGGQIGMGTLGAGAVSTSAAGAYVAQFDGGAATFTFEQPQPCVFTQVSEMKDQPTTKVKFDLNQVANIAFTDQGKYNGLNAVVLTLTGGDGMVTLLAADGTATAVPAAASIVTSLSLDDLKAAAAALRVACPAKN